MITKTTIKMIIKRFFRLIWLSLSHFNRSCYLYIYIYTYIDDYQIVFDNWRLKDYFDNQQWIRSFVIWFLAISFFFLCLFNIILYIIEFILLYWHNLKYYIISLYFMFCFLEHIIVIFIIICWNEIPRQMNQSKNE